MHENRKQAYYTANYSRPTKKQRKKRERERESFER